MTPIEPYRLVEPKRFSDTELAAFAPRKQRPLWREAVWFSLKYVGFLAAVYVFVVALMLVL